MVSTGRPESCRYWAPGAQNMLHWWVPSTPALNNAGMLKNKIKLKLRQKSSFIMIKQQEMRSDAFKRLVACGYKKRHKIISFFYNGFLHRHWRSQDSTGREGTIFYSTLPLPPAHEHWDIYLHLCIWDDYHVFSIATLVFTWLLDEIYHLIELPFQWLIHDAIFVCSLDKLILHFCYSDWTLGTARLKLVSTITLKLQANRLTKYACHTKFW